LPSTRTRRRAAWEIWRNSETSLLEVFGGEIVHQEPDRAAVHAVDRLARCHEAMQAPQHETVAAERHDDIGGLGIGVAIFFGQPLQRALRFRALARDESNPLVTSRRAVH
jgi:hypothetical protein